jgi:excisionase family DNA binding protein
MLNTRTSPSQNAEPLVVRPAAAGQLLGCGRTRIYELLDAGELHSFNDGRSRKIPVASIRAYIERKLSPSGKQTAEGTKPVTLPGAAVTLSVDGSSASAAETVRVRGRRAGRLAVRHVANRQHAVRRGA